MTQLSAVIVLVVLILAIYFLRGVWQRQNSPRFAVGDRVQVIEEGYWANGVLGTAELVFAVIVLYIALSLPFPPPDGQTRVLFVHWYGMVAFAIGLTVSLRRPSRNAWAVASILSAYFLFNFAVGFRAGVAAALNQDVGPAFALSYAIVGIAVLAQVDVAVRCWRARSLRTSAQTSDLS